MNGRNRLALAALWILSLVAVAEWSGRAQTAPQVGQEVRFLKSEAALGAHRGVLIANFNGQWLPVTLDEMPDGNSLIRR